MNKLYNGINEAKRHLNEGEEIYSLVYNDDCKLIFFLDGFVGVKIELNRSAIIKYDLFSYHLPTDEIYKIVETLLNDLNSNLSYLLLDLI